MAHSFLSRVVYIILFLYLSFINFCSLTQHPILELFAEPFEDIDSTMLKRYGSVHTMMDYIYWSKTEEYIYPILQEKMSWLLHEKILIKRYLKWHLGQYLNRLFHLILSKRPKVFNHVRDHLGKHSYTVIRGNSKFYAVLF